MRSGLVVAAFSLLVVSIGCGSQPTASSNPTSASASSRIPCADIKAPHHAYVVVQHMSGDWIQRCIGFAPTYIDGQTIMDRSGIQYQVQYLEAGKAVCQVDLEPRQYRECVPPNSPRWALFIESQGRWSKASGGYTDIQLGDGDALGWRYVRPEDQAPGSPPLPRRV